MLTQYQALTSWEECRKDMEHGLGEEGPWQGRQEMRF